MVEIKIQIVNLISDNKSQHGDLINAYNQLEARKIICKSKALLYKF